MAAFFALCVQEVGSHHKYEPGANDGSLRAEEILEEIFGTAGYRILPRIDFRHSVSSACIK